MLLHSEGVWLSGQGRMGGACARVRELWWKLGVPSPWLD